MVNDFEIIKETIRIYEESMKQIEKEVAELCVYMEGGVTWDVAWELSFKERQLLYKVLNRKLQAQSGSKKEYM